MTGLWTRIVLISAVVIAATGCATSAVDYVGFNYYIYGPEAALEVLDEYETAPEDRALAEVERAMALLELGRYTESSAALDRAALVLGRTGEGTPVGSSDGKPSWQPEYHERVMVQTMQIAAALAVQDVVKAASAADRAGIAIDEVACESCRFAFTRFLAALAYEGAGRHGDGLDLLAQISLVGRGGELIEELQHRLEGGVAGDQPAGWAPPPVEVERTLEVVLLLGRGPFKEADKLLVAETETIRWSRFLPRDPQTVTWAALEVEDPVISVELSDVEDLAVASLRARADRVVAARGSGLSSKAYDLRHWSSLPASLHLLNLELPPDHETVDLVYYSPEGYEIDRETIWWPEDWDGGRLFVIRRMP